MIVDIHTHVFDPDADFLPKLRADLDRCGVDPASWGSVAKRHLEMTQAADVAVVFGLQAAATGWAIPNNRVAAQVNQAPGRLLFFAAVDPADAGALEELERCHRDLGAVGLKLAPLYQGLSPTDPRCEALYRYCEGAGLPILFHTGTSFVSGTPLAYSRPVAFDEVACRFPELRMILAHLGHPWEGETIAVIRRHPHVYADVSALYYRPWQFYNSLRLLQEYRAGHKVLFGSDFPFTTTGDSLEGVRSMPAFARQHHLPPIDEALVEEIIQRNALECLGLPDPRKP